MSFRPARSRGALAATVAILAFVGIPGSPSAQDPADESDACAVVQAGTDTGETLVGTPDGDEIAGGGGDDTLEGMAASDCLSGGTGADTITGGLGRDRLVGGRGRDRIFSRDRERDVVRCGRGRDVVIANRFDRLFGCEKRKLGKRGSGGGRAADTSAPETNIAAGPGEGSSTTSTTASFSFSGTDNRGVVGYECRLDDSVWSSCSSPNASNELGVGAHSFGVRAKDAAGNVDPSPATRAWNVTAPGDVHTVPTSIPSGCSNDATAQILSWVASVPDGSTLRFGSGACYRIEGTLELRKRNLEIDGNGSTFKSQDAPTGQRALWRAWDSTLHLRNMTLTGSYANGGVHTETLQWAHAIDLRGTHGVVENVSMSDVAGDCVYFGLGASRSSGAVRDSSCRRIGRNGVSVVAGDDIRVERMTTDRIGYIAFDVEPNEGPGNGSARVVFDSNQIGSYQMKAYTVIGNAPITDQEFTNNRVVGQGLKIGVVNRTHRPQRLKISGNSSNTPVAPAAMNLDGIDGLTVTGNTVPLTTGTMAQVRYSCGVSVTGNSYPGGLKQLSILEPSC